MALATDFYALIWRRLAVSSLLTTERRQVLGWSALRLGAVANDFNGRR
jgi:hypothetical protein